jgi:hypothetical protein
VKRGGRKHRLWVVARGASARAAQPNCGFYALRRRSRKPTPGKTRMSRERERVWKDLLPDQSLQKRLETLTAISFSANNIV